MLKSQSIIRNTTQTWTWMSVTVCYLLTWSWAGFTSMKRFKTNPFPNLSAPTT